ncbi:hypothetical protein GCM10022255_019050 [Dactylosporangium darangshiense]|uniref:Uncharacterized protein n=1 Tax=Dactylosporangium darangshiense TaxID=579108 RepID=A0ABP8D3B8_9ACTN
MKAFSRVATVAGQPPAADDLAEGAALLGAAAGALDAGAALAAGAALSTGSSSEQPARRVARSRLGRATGNAMRVFTCGIVRPGRSARLSVSRHAFEEAAEHLHHQRMIVRLRQP